jgi:hypothetical protein
MKNIKIIIAFFGIIIFNSCQEVVDIPLDTDKPRLVIEASINWQKGTIGNEQKIKLTTTTDYYTNIIPTVSGATITIKNSANVVFNFIENGNTGEYICTNFLPVLNETYTLNVTVNGQNYSAKENLIAVPTITNVVQNNNGGITGNKIEIKTYFNDTPNVDNYYLYKYQYLNIIKPDFYTDEDRFFQGNQFFSISQKRDLEVGDQIQITHYGISQQCYNYMNILLSITGNQGGGPFQSPPATVKGNIKNDTNFDNYPLGYFRLSEIDVKNYTVQ